MNTALRPTFAQLIGLADSAPKHAHGGRRPCDQANDEQHREAQQQHTGDDCRGATGELRDQQRADDHFDDRQDSGHDTGNAEIGRLGSPLRAGADSLSTPETTKTAPSSTLATTITAPR